MLLSRFSKQAVKRVQHLLQPKLFQPFSTVTPIQVNTPEAEQRLSAENVDSDTEKRLVLAAYKFIRYY